MRLVHRVDRERPSAPPAQDYASRPVHLELILVQLIERMRLAVVFGGNKAVQGAVIRQAQNPRSWKSYEAVARDIAAAMERIGCRRVAVLPDDMRLAGRLQHERIHLAWLNTGGVQGHCSVAHAAALLEMLGLPYVGHDPLAAATLDSKHYFKRQLVALGLPTAPFHVWHPGERIPGLDCAAEFRAAFPDWDSGFIVKPVSGRASLHVHYVEQRRDVGDAVRRVHEATHNAVLIEAYLPGREFCIAVSGPIIARGSRLEQLPTPFAFAGVERVLGDDERVFTSMDVRPITSGRVRPLDAIDDAAVLESLEDMACRLYQGLRLKTLVRLDVRADARGNLFVLEANPKPDLKAPDDKQTSLISAGLERYAMDYDDLILSMFANRVAELHAECHGSAEQLFDRFQD